MTSSAIAIDPLSVTSAAFLQHGRALGLGSIDLLGVYRAAYRAGDLGSTSAVVAPIEEQLIEGDTTKFVQALESGSAIESVIIPSTGRSGRRRQTLCVSSQVGCAMGCKFCQTAQMGLISQLTPSQIVGQWFAARHQLGSQIDNIVFMGMGEPMENLDAVICAIEIFADQNGPGIAPSRMTVSTVGRIAGIQRLADFARKPGFRRLRLAVSVNASNDDIRSQIMPINRAEPLQQLVQAMHEWPERVLIEYVFIPTVNDQLQHADELADLLHDLNCTINVIPYNPRHDSPWPAPCESDVNAFVQRLSDAGLRVRCRRTRGRSVMAACGQLGRGKRERTHLTRRRQQIQ